MKDDRTLKEKLAEVEQWRQQDSQDQVDEALANSIRQTLSTDTVEERLDRLLNGNVEDELRKRLHLERERSSD